MLPVSQAVQASKATQARAADPVDGGSGGGFAALLNGMQGPPSPPAVPAGGAPATAGATAAGDASGSSGVNAADGSTAAAARPGVAASAGRRDAGDTPADGGADGNTGNSGGPAAAAPGPAPASTSGSEGSAARPRRAAVPLVADGSAAAVAAAQQALALQQAQGTAAPARGDRQDPATGRAGIARATVMTAPRGLAAPGAAAGDTGNAGAAAIDDDGTFADALAAQAGARPGRPGSALVHGGAGAGLAGAGREVDSPEAGATLSAGLGALLARNGAAATPTTSDAASGLAAALRPGSGSAPGDASPWYAPLLGAGPAGAQAPSAAAPPSPTLAIAPALGDERWSAALGQQALFMARNQLSSAQLTVSPPDLGPIQITLDLNHDQATAVFVSPHDAVRQAIEASLPQLRDMFSAAGLQLSNAQVQADAGGNAWTAAGGQGQPQPGNRGGGGGEGPAGSTPTALAGGAPTRIARGLLDTFA